MVPWNARAAGGRAPPRPRSRKEHHITTHVLRVENLSDTITESDLIALFSGVGQVREVSLPTDRATGEPRGYALLQFADEAGAHRAVERLDGYELEGSAIKVEYADSRKSGGRGGPGSLWGAGHAGSRPKGSRRGARRRKRGL